MEWWGIALVLKSSTWNSSNAVHGRGIQGWCIIYRWALKKRKPSIRRENMFGSAQSLSTQVWIDVEMGTYPVTERIHNDAQILVYIYLGLVCTFDVCTMYVDMACTCLRTNLLVLQHGEEWLIIIISTGKPTRTIDLYTYYRYVPTLGTCLEYTYIHTYLPPVPSSRSGPDARQCKQTKTTRRRRKAGGGGDSPVGK